MKRVMDQNLLPQRTQRGAEFKPRASFKFFSAFLCVLRGLVNNYMFDLIPYEQMDVILAEFRRVLKTDGKMILVNMTRGEKCCSWVYDAIYNISPKTMEGCRGVQLSEKLQIHGFTVNVREYHQQMLFPSEVILAHK